jgi:hypothetical protein
MIYQISEMLKKLFANGTIPVLLASVTLAGNKNQIDFHSLQYALFITSIVEVLGAVFFFFAAHNIVKDKELAETETPGWPRYTPIVN